jgi:hypothetical protein
VLEVVVVTSHSVVILGSLVLEGVQGGVVACVREGER